MIQTNPKDIMCFDFFLYAFEPTYFQTTVEDIQFFPRVGKPQTQDNDSELILRW